MEKPNNVSGSWGLMIAIYGIEAIKAIEFIEAIEDVDIIKAIESTKPGIQSATKILQQNRTNNKEYDTEYLVYVPDPDDYVPEFEMEPYARLNFNDK